MICTQCPRQCNVDRSFSKGYCNEYEKIKIAKYCLFNFEEPLISGKNGSGAIFFCGCSLKCVFCQNYDISSLDRGKEISVEELAQIFKHLESIGAENINLVNPTHYAMQIIEALKIYRPSIPIVYNTHGYEKIETLKLLKDGKILSGMIVRHLIMPLMTDQSILILGWIKQNLPNTMVSLMAQYIPYGKANEFKEINRRITKREYQKVLEAYLDLNLTGFVQERESADTVYIPKWDY